MLKELVCISCPLGCPLTVEIENGEVTGIKGNSCKRGEIYGKKEATSPMRVVTSTVCVRGGAINRASVKTESDIPKDRVFDCMDEIRKTVVDAPVHIGDVIIKNCAGTGIAVIATKNVPEMPHPQILL